MKTSDIQAREISDMTNSTMKHSIDLSYLNDMSDGDESFVMSMLESFLNSVPSILQKIDIYHQEEKWNELAKEIHKLKPTLKYLGVNSLNEIMITTEANCKVPQQQDQISQGVEQIARVTTSVLNEARSIVES